MSLKKSSKLINGGWNKSGGLEKISKINNRGGGDNFSVVKSIF